MFLPKKMSKQPQKTNSPSKERISFNYRKKKQFSKQKISYTCAKKLKCFISDVF